VQGKLVKTPAWVQGGCFEKGSRIKQRTAMRADMWGEGAEGSSDAQRGAAACCH
jgi:hypothetical protein